MSTTRPTKEVLQRLARWYSLIAITAFSTVLLLIFFNIALGIAFYFRGTEPGKVSGKPPEYPEAAFRAVYPDFTPEERKQLLWENWTRPFGYDDYVHFKELPFTGKYVNVSK